MENEYLEKALVGFLLGLGMLIFISPFYYPYY